MIHKEIAFSHSEAKQPWGFSRIRASLQDSFVRWASKRSKLSESFTLHRKNLYIFPTITGGAFLLLALVIWLLGTNYQNNLILALAYFQISLFVIVILNTYNNLSGVQIIIGRVNRVSVGDKIDFNFSVNSSNRIGTHYVNAAWRGSIGAHLFDFEPNETHKIHVIEEASVRGYFRVKPLLIESTFPMGLVRCWTWLNFDSSVLVYPEPIACSLPKTISVSGSDGDGSGLHLMSGDDFAGFTPYQPGDSPKHLAWALYAKGQGLHRKLYGAPQPLSISLNWSDFYSGDVETCLSNLCYWAKQMANNGQAFGLSLPNSSIDIGEGDSHLIEVLTALALYEGGEL